MTGLAATGARGQARGHLCTVCGCPCRCPRLNSAAIPKSWATAWCWCVGEAARAWKGGAYGRNSAEYTPGGGWLWMQQWGCQGHAMPSHCQKHWMKYRTGRARVGSSAGGWLGPKCDLQRRVTGHLPRHSSPRQSSAESYLRLNRSSGYLPVCRAAPSRSAIMHQQKGVPCVPIGLACPKLPKIPYC